MARIALLAAGLLAGCASSIMDSYVGKSLMTPVSQYGPPATAYDTGPDSRAFLWKLDQQYVVPGSSAGSFSATAVGGSVYGRSSYFSTPPHVVTGTCFYTLYAKRVAEIDSPVGWVVTGFERPRLMCE